MSAREIKAAHRAFAEAAVRHDLDAITGVFAIDAIIMPPDAEMVEGRAACSTGRAPSTAACPA